MGSCLSFVCKCMVYENVALDLGGQTSGKFSEVVGSPVSPRFPLRNSNKIITLALSIRAKQALHPFRENKQSSKEL